MCRFMPLIYLLFNCPVLGSLQTEQRNPEVFTDAGPPDLVQTT